MRRYVTAALAPITRDAETVNVSADDTWLPQTRREFLAQEATPVVHEDRPRVAADGLHHEQPAAIRPDVVARVRDVVEIIGQAEDRAALAEREGRSGGYGGDFDAAVRQSVVDRVPRLRPNRFGAALIAHL